ncbi:MAG TPA: AI-2E family transporter [Acidimicrobiales bacterium]|nr:AI-2E family transporter [Acidimicrobiales bacterium]
MSAVEEGPAGAVAGEGPDPQPGAATPADPAGHADPAGDGQPAAAGAGPAEAAGDVDPAERGRWGRIPAPEVPLVLQAAAAWSWRLLIVLAAVCVLGYVLIRLYVVVVPVILALFLAAVLEPLVSRLARRGPRTLAAAAVFLGTLVLLSSAVYWIGSEVAEEFEAVGQQLNAAIEDAKSWLQGDPFNYTAERVDQLEANVRDAIRRSFAGLSERTGEGVRIAGEALGGIVLLLFTLFFLLKDGARMANWFTSRLPPNHRTDVLAMSRRSRSIMRQYLVATAATGLIDGVLIGIALLVLGVPLVLPLAVLTFLGGFIPIVGATVAGFVAAVVALVDGGIVVALLVVAATIVVQQVEGNLLQPLILERAVRLHPLVTVWAVGAGLIVGGFLGAFLSVPLVAIAVAAMSHYRTRAGTSMEDVSWEQSKRRRRRRGRESAQGGEEAEGTAVAAPAVAAPAGPDGGAGRPEG